MQYLSTLRYRTNRCNFCLILENYSLLIHFRAFAMLKQIAVPFGLSFSEKKKKLFFMDKEREN